MEDEDEKGEKNNFGNIKEIINEKTQLEKDIKDNIFIKEDLEYFWNIFNKEGINLMKEKAKIIEIWILMIKKLNN